jgi:hypothetical protein
MPVLCFIENSENMFGLFKKKSQKEILLEKYRQLKEEAFILSKSDRSLSDAKTAEAEAILQQLESISE